MPAYGIALSLRLLPSLVPHLVKLNGDLNNRSTVSDLTEEADGGRNGKRIVRCNLNTLNTPYKDGLTNYSSGMAIISMDNDNIGSILYMTEGNPALFINVKTNGAWRGWKEYAMKNDFTPRNIEIPFAEGIVSDTGHNKVALSVSGNVAKIHFRAKRTTGNYTIATIPEGYRPIFQANCAMTVPVNAGHVSTVYSAVVESSGILRFSGAIPSEQIFEGDIVYIIK